MSRQLQPFTNDNHESQRIAKGKKRLVDIICAGTKQIWNKKVPGTQLEKFKSVIQDKYGLTFETYWDLHEWSIKNYPQFWEDVWHYFGVIHSKTFTETAKRKGDGFLDIEWFAGAKMNFAENILRYRDDKVALTCVNEDGYEKIVTFAEMFEEVKLYAAAFKKHGLRKGDTVACYISNRREAIYTLFAAASIGAMFGAVLPFYGAKVTSEIMNIINPNFLITIDGFQYNKQKYNILEKLPEIVNENKSIKKVIIVQNGEDSKSKDITTVKNSHFLDEFLSVAYNQDGTVPDLIFEQLSFNHPVFLSFTSGTTGLPKGIIHSAGTFLPVLRDFGMHYNIDSNDVFLALQPPGWIVWNVLVNNLALGASLLLFDGFPLFQSKHGFWDIMDRYKVSFAYLVASRVDLLEKEGIVPAPGCKLEHLKMICIGASPVKLQNVDFIHQKVKPDVHVSCLYGSTETIGLYSGFDFNSPVFSSEIQCPPLGVDIKILDEEGNCIIGKAGEIVLATPTPSLPIGMLNDENGEKLKKNYFSKFPGVWNQSDEAWMDPDTKGMIIIGRSDHTIKQGGLLFVSEEIYWALHDIEEIADNICVAQSADNGDSRAVLFVKMKAHYILDSVMLNKIERKICEDLHHMYIPQVILPVSDIPYNLNGKRMEILVKKIINTNTIPEVTNIRNPECLNEYANIPEILNF